MNAHDIFDLLDWKRRVFSLYAEVRSTDDPEAAWSHWRRGRDALFRNHPQSPLAAEERDRFIGLPFFDYNPSYRVLAEVRPVEKKRHEVATSGDTAMAFIRFASVRVELGGDAETLELYWLDAYGGGLFLPFRDGTSGGETYGAGRYLLDTAKGADLGTENEALVLDFNFSYNPSCSYDPRWVCPLAPPANRMQARVEAGETNPG